MMALPDDLAALEAELAGRPRPAAPAGLGDRAVAAARGEIARSRWSFAGALAAAAVLALHLMVLGAMGTDYVGAGPQRDRAELAREIRRLCPDLPEGEGERMARLAGRR
jgi:hypothetical protein